MIKKFLLAIMIALPLCGFAQKFGQVDTQAIVTAMPEVTAMQTQLEASSKTYETEFQKLQEENYLIGSANVPVRLAYYLSEINVLHPFREGNGRTQRLFIEYLAGVAGYKVDFSSVSAREMVVASANSFALDYQEINAMFERITSPISQAEQKEKIKLFFGTRSQQYRQFIS